MTLAYRIFQQLLVDFPKSESFFERSRWFVYKDHRAYDGFYYNNLLTRYALEEVTTKDYFPRFGENRRKLCTISPTLVKSPYFSLNKEVFATHSFVACGEDYILDLSYKRLFLDKKRGCKFMHSPYLEVLYNLPPVFLGTREELKNLAKVLLTLKSYDREKEDSLFLYSFLEKEEEW